MTDVPVFVAAAGPLRLMNSSHSALMWYVPGVLGAKYVTVNSFPPAI